MVWKILSYPVLIFVIILVTTLVDFVSVPVIVALRNRKAIAITAFAVKDLLAPVAAVFIAVTIAINTALRIPLAIVIVAFILHARNGLQRLRVAELGVSRPALAAAAAGQAYDVAGEVRMEWIALITLNVGFAVAVGIWWSVFEGFF